MGTISAIILPLHGPGRAGSPIWALRPPHTPRGWASWGSSFVAFYSPTKIDNYSLIIKSTTEHCGLEVGYPLNSVPTLTCHLHTWRKDSGKETLAQPGNPFLP